MGFHLGDTICAIATAPGGAARGIVRISGPDALSIADRVFITDDSQRKTSSSLARALSGLVRVSRDAALAGEARSSGNPVESDAGVQLPCDLFLWPTARSYTREPVAELHTVGAPPLLEALLDSVCSAGARLAQPGEFAVRAFLAGRIDLTQAEAVLGVIDARGDRELAAALKQLAGGVARPLHQLREDLLQLLSDLEAGLDFVEEDIEFIAPEEARGRLRAAAGLLAEIHAQMHLRDEGQRSRQVALTGEPNVGKSSLFNGFVSRFGISGASRTGEALVSPVRGTTRDYLTGRVDLDGISCDLVDTAGIDANGQQHEIEAAAQSLARERRDAAAVRVCCIEASSERPRFSDLGEQCDIVVLTKSDLCQSPAPWEASSTLEVPVVPTSSRTGAGLAELRSVLREQLMGESAGTAAQLVTSTAERCRESIRLAGAALRRAEEIFVARAGEELAAAELRTALAELGQVVGAVYTDDLLDRIFSKFCIGK